LLDELDCIYLDTAESRGLVPEDHPSLMPSMRAKAMNEADLVFTVGRSLDFQLGYGSAAVFPNALFIRTGTTPLELRDSRRADIELPGSAAEVLTALCETAVGMLPSRDRAWVQSMRTEDRERREKLARSMRAVQPGRDGYMHPYRLLSCLKENLNGDAVVVADGGDLLSFARVAMTGAAYLDCGPFGCLGVGVPYGIAAALAFPGRQVAVVTGDGSFGFNAIELDSCRRHGAKVLFVVANNSGWNIERNDQIENYGSRIFGTELEDCDYAGFARSLGVYGEKVVDPAGLSDAIKRALEKAPALLDVTVTRDALSPDFLSGLAGVPERQALSKWDKLESERLKG
jgi:acetolactate synthase-1/2/3 large subunit